MEAIDLYEITDVDFPEAPGAEGGSKCEIVPKDGHRRTDVVWRKWTPGLLFGVYYSNCGGPAKRILSDTISNPATASRKLTLRCTAYHQSLFLLP